MKTKYFWLVGLSVIFSLSYPNNSSHKIFDYHHLKESQNEMYEQLHEYGFIAIQGVPGYEQAYNNFLEQAQAFVALNENEKLACMPNDSFGRGWSMGIEKFKGVLDAYKGSYYARYPEAHIEKENIWPKSLPDFQGAYLSLAKIIYKTGKHLLPLLKLPSEKISGVGRMLYYAPVKNNDEPENQNWCGLHKDHGLFTGLTPAFYLKDGIVIKEPQNAGLFVRGEKVSMPRDVLLFQVGEAGELISDGKIIATEHCVKKARGGFERYAFAFFFDTDPFLKIDSTVTAYNDRYQHGMTYKEWSEASYNKYKAAQG